MLLTPEFSLSQTDSHVEIAIRAPFVKISETEISAQGCDFYFYSRPYHLRLKLPGPIVDTEQIEDEKECTKKKSPCKVKYDVDRQMFDISIEKAEPGQFFEGLGLITNLLASSCVADKEVVAGGERRQLIEEIDHPEPTTTAQRQQSIIIAIPPNFNWTLEKEEEHVHDYGDYDDYGLNDDNDDEDSVAPQATKISVKLPGSVLTSDDSSPGSSDNNNFSYGFGNRFRDEEGTQNKARFAKIQECFPDVVNFREPVSQLSLKQRFEMKIAKEKEEFSQDHYLANLFDNEDRKTIEKYLEFTLPEPKLTPEDRKDLVEKLKNRTYLLSHEEAVSAFLGLVDILFAYCYDLRINEGEHCVESDWNISKLSATLSWFVQFKSLKKVQISCFRRTLTYPLYRSFELANKCWSDTVNLIKSGQEAVLHALLAVRRTFALSDSSTSPKYILNELFLNDYCVWIQKVKPEHLKSLSEAMEDLGVLPKNETGFDLEMIENQGLQVLEGDEACDPDQVRGVELSASLGRHSCDSEDLPMQLSKIAFSTTKSAGAAS